MKIREQYKINKDSKVGTKCTCPSCGTSFEKTNYQQVFCKSRPGTQCKDKYWNTVDPKKRNNTTRISPANARWQERQADLRDQWITNNHRWYFDDDPGWDAHKD